MQAIFTQIAVTPDNYFPLDFIDEVEEASLKRPAR
jgi:hypothetical protein